MVLSTRRIVSELRKQMAKNGAKSLSRLEVAYLLDMSECALEAREKRNASIAKELLLFSIKHDINLVALATTGNLIKNKK